MPIYTCSKLYFILSEPSTSMYDSGFNQYRKTCSIIFGNATASQLRYLNASIELQQTLLTSCDSIVANQLNWLENYVKQKKGSNLFVEPFLRVYASMVDLCMTYISTSYDSGTVNMQWYTKTVDRFNQLNLKIKENEAESQGVPLSQS
jgi:hypothetical protein